ncbi:MAG: hypothetical protein R2873_32425 [Caldilineaceae bacterium]
MVYGKDHISQGIVGVVEQVIAGAGLRVHQDHGVVGFELVLGLKGGDAFHVWDELIGHGAVFGSPNESSVRQGTFSVGQEVFEQRQHAVATADGVGIGIIVQQDQRMFSLRQILCQLLDAAFHCTLALRRVVFGQCQDSQGAVHFCWGWRVAGPIITGFRSGRKRGKRGQKAKIVCGVGV